jgi:replication initiation protein RepC
MQTVENGTGDVRRLAAAQWAAARLVEAYQGLPEGVSKAMLLDRFERAAPRLGVGDGVVRLIRALVRLTQEQDWTGGRFRPIAWPSNEILGEELQRSRTVVQGLIRQAVRLGLVHMKDSGNGKRYGFRGDQGEIVEAFGFDLSPLAVRWEEFADLTAVRGLELAHRRRLRARLGELRREIRTLCADAIAREYEGFDWDAAIDEASGRVPRGATLAQLESLVAEFEGLLGAVDRAWMVSRRATDSEPRGFESRAHIKPTTDPTAQATYQAFQKEVVAEGPSRTGTAGDDALAGVSNEEVIPLSLVLEAIPEIEPYLEAPAAAEWEDLVAAAYKASFLLGINLSAWRQARDLMGRTRAAVAVATILARWRNGEIKSSAGGYLRAMCEREATGDLHLLPSLYGLKERHHPRTRRSGRPGEAS